MAVACAEPPSRVCTLIGCDEVARVHVLTVSDPSEIADTAIEICHNDQCVSGPVPLPSQSASYGIGLQIRVDVVTTSSNTTELEVRIETVSDPEAAVDGDVYTMLLLRNGGATLVSGRWTATYTDSYPNGRDCNRCVYAQLTAM